MMLRKGPERKDSFRFFSFSGQRGKYIAGAVLLLFVFSARGMLFRDLWFDEALTVLNFALMKSPSQIYNSYFIPNNQIIHTVFIHWWMQLFSLEFLRFFPLLCGILTLIFLWKMRRHSGTVAMLTVLVTLAVSFTFTLYGTALRGYMLAALAATGGTWALCRYMQCGKRRFLAGWFIFSLLGVGTMPGTLAALAGAGIYASGFLPQKFWKSSRLYWGIAAPLAAFVLFYLPIFERLRANAALGEGWHSGGEMLAALSLGIIFTFLPLLPAALAGTAWKPGFSPRHLRLLIWLLPIPAAYCFKVAPFPRVFFPLFPVYALLLARALNHFYARLHRKKRCCLPVAAVILLIGGLAWGLVCRFETVRAAAGSYHFVSGQDDFIDCHFVRSSFVPGETACLFKERYPGDHTVYATFGSDPWALLYAFMSNGAETKIVFDGPGGRIRGVPRWVIKHRDENISEVEKRFNCKYREAFSSPNHTILELDGE